jgi:hypothetical protein
VNIEYCRLFRWYFCGLSHQYTFFSAGNRRLMDLVVASVDVYNKAKSRQEKSKVISTIVDQILESTNPRGGFVMRDANTRKWHQVDLKVARDKVGNYLREATKRKVTEKASSFLVRSSSAPLMKWREDGEDLWQRTASSREVRLDSIMNEEFDLKVLDRHGAQQSWSSKHQAGGAVKVPPRLPLPHPMALVPQIPLFNSSIFSLQPTPSIFSTASGTKQRMLGRHSCPDELHLKTCLEALAETFSQEDDRNFDFEPRPIEDMLG